MFLNRQKKYYENGKESTVFEIAICEDCGRIAVVGKIEDRKLLQTSKLEDKTSFDKVQVLVEEYVEERKLAS